jgi:hypothetical protein
MFRRDIAIVDRESWNFIRSRAAKIVTVRKSLPGSRTTVSVANGLGPQATLFSFECSQYTEHRYSVAKYISKLAFC